MPVFVPVFGPVPGSRDECVSGYGVTYATSAPRKFYFVLWTSTKPHRRQNFVCDNEPVLFRPRPKVNSGIGLFDFLLGSEYTRDKHRASSFHGPDLITGVLKCDFMRRSVTRMAKRLVFVLCHV